ncbi:MAG: GNAT family N-acetyltransferase [Clostridia bacterium]|nr:GNAT family N-acetyltransferase [Clostridia bacterium]
MSQLKMYWLKGTPIADYELPEGYSMVNYKECTEDKAAWVECCKNGLVGDDTAPEFFDDCVADVDDCIPEKDVFFLDYEGEHIGTIAAIYHPEGNYGQVHMVGIKTEFRGKGLGKYLNNVAVKKLNAQGVDYIYLTTDEWRMGAVKSYLTAGFIPVEYEEDEDMKGRWEWMLCELGVDSVDMVYEDCSFCRKLEKAPVVKVGVVGVGRGRTMINHCDHVKGAKTVAICDNYDILLDKAKKDYADRDITFYDNYEDFLNHDMDVVVLANFATEHAPFAVKALEKGFHVLSEVLPVLTMKEAVELIEAVERTGKKYFYAENYCYMGAPKKMKELYEEGELGEFEYGEGEYMHNCEDIWHMITFGDPNHWRNTMHACYYCTHSIGPLIHITGLKPVKVTGFELPFNARMARMGAKAGPVGIEMITLENGAILKSIHGVGPSRNSVWYSIYGSKGRMECAREDPCESGHVNKLYVNVDEYEGQNINEPEERSTGDCFSRLAAPSGHGGSDWYVMHNVVETVRGRENMDVIDVYEAMDMFLPGMFAYRSVLQGGIPLDIPDLRNPEEREKWRNDTECTVAKAAGDMLVPGYSKGNPDIPAETYEGIKKKFEEEWAKKIAENK